MPNSLDVSKGKNQGDLGLVNNLARILVHALPVAGTPSHGCSSLAEHFWTHVYVNYSHRFGP
jgi:hypothetical protein